MNASPRHLILTPDQPTLHYPINAVSQAGMQQLSIFQSRPGKEPATFCDLCGFFYHMSNKVAKN